MVFPTKGSFEVILESWPQWDLNQKRAAFAVNLVLVYWYGYPKKCPQKTKNQILKLTYLFLKTKFYETFQDFPIDHPFTSKCGMTTLSFNFSLD